MQPLWRWHDQEVWAQDAKASLAFWSAEHKRDLGHIGQREVSAMAQELRPRNFRVSMTRGRSTSVLPRTISGGGLRSETSMEGVHSCVAVDLPFSHIASRGGGGEACEYLKFGFTFFPTSQPPSECPHIASEEDLQVIRSGARIEHPGFGCRWCGGTTTFTIEHGIAEQGRQLLQCVLSMNGGAEVECNMQALLSARDMICPSIEDCVVWADLLCSFPMMPSDLESIVRSAIQAHIASDATYSQDSDSDYLRDRFGLLDPLRMEGPPRTKQKLADPDDCFIVRMSI